jgi:hypothetical protein
MAESANDENATTRLPASRVGDRRRTGPMTTHHSPASTGTITSTSLLPEQLFMAAQAVTLNHETAFLCVLGVSAVSAFSEQVHRETR